MTTERIDDPRDPAKPTTSVDHQAPSAALLLRSDAHRYCGGSSFRHVAKTALLSRTFRVLVSLRLSQWTATRPGLTFRLAHVIMRVIHRNLTARAAMDFPWNAQVGAGLLIVHGWGLVVSPGAVIGSNVTLFHGVTLGRSDDIVPGQERTTSFPTIGDDVWVGPGVAIVGGVRIGDGCRVLPNSAVSKSFAAQTLVAGVPAEAVRETPPDVRFPVPIEMLERILRPE